MKTYYFDTKDHHQMAYHDIGKGFPIVFLHGNGLSKNYFNHQYDLASEYRLIMVDSRGHGESAHLQGPTSFSQMADDLDQLLEALRVSQCLLVGHSDGANLALCYSLRYPSRVKGLLFNGGNLKFSDLRLLARLGVHTQVFALRSLAKLIPSFRNAALVSALLKENIPVSLTDLKSLSCPVLLVLGHLDLVKPSLFEQMSAALPNGSFTTLGIGHNPARTRSKAFNHLIRQLLSTTTIKGETHDSH